MSLIRVGTIAFPITPNPPAGRFYLGLDSNNANHLTRQDSSGTLTDYEASATLNINGLTEQTDPSVNNLVALYDPVLLANRKVQRRELLLTDVDLVSFERNDFIESHLGGLTASVTGSGASAQVGTYGIDGANQARGVSQCDTGTTATGRCALNTANMAQLFLSSGDEYRWSMRLAMEALSTPTETFTIFAGLGSNFQAAGFAGQFVGFRYNDAINGGNWQALVVVGGVINDAGDTGIVGDIDYHKFEVNLTPTQAVFKIDGVITNTLTVGLPSGPSQAFGYGAKIEKSVGTTQRNLSIDYYRMAYLRSAER